jgi:hypothetical protein
MGEMCEVRRWDGLRRNHKHTNSHDDWSRHSSINKVITPTIWEAAVLVLPAEDIYDICLEMALGCMMYTRLFMTIGVGIQLILKLLPQQFERLQCWYYWREEFMKYAVEMASGGIIYIPGFIKISSGVQKLLGGATHTDTRRRSLTQSQVIS